MSNRCDLCGAERDFPDSYGPGEDHDCHPPEGDPLVALARERAAKEEARQLVSIASDRTNAALELVAVIARQAAEEALRRAHVNGSTAGDVVAHEQARALVDPRPGLVKCPTCSGIGTTPAGPWPRVVCPDCGGQGYLLALPTHAPAITGPDLSAPLDSLRCPHGVPVAQPCPLCTTTPKETP